MSEMRKELEHTRKSRDHWWDAWKRVIAELYQLRDEFAPMKRAYKRMAEETRELRSKLWCIAAELVTLKSEHVQLKGVHKRCADQLREADEALIDTLEEASCLDEVSGLKQDQITSLQKSLKYWKTLHASAAVVIQAANRKADDYSARLDNLNRNYNSVLAKEIVANQVHVNQVYKERQIALNEVSDLRRKRDIMHQELRMANKTIDRLADENTGLRGENTRLRDRAVQGCLNRVVKALGEEIDKAGPIYTPGGVKLRKTGLFIATAEQYVIQSRAAAKKMSGFTTLPDDKPDTVPFNTEFAIGGKMVVREDGALNSFGTETTTIKLTDDTLYEALTGLLEENPQNWAGPTNGPNSPAKLGSRLGIGQQPEILAAVTIKDGCRITLKLKVGRAVHELQTFLVARPAKT